MMHCCTALLLSNKFCLPERVVLTKLCRQYLIEDKTFYLDPEISKGVCYIKGLLYCQVFRVSNHPRTGVGSKKFDYPFRQGTPFVYQRQRIDLV